MTLFFVKAKRRERRKKRRENTTKVLRWYPVRVAGLSLIKSAENLGPSSFFAFHVHVDTYTCLAPYTCDTTSNINTRRVLIQLRVCVHARTWACSRSLLLRCWKKKRTNTARLLLCYQLQLAHVWERAQHILKVWPEKLVNFDVNPAWLAYNFSIAEGTCLNTPTSSRKLVLIREQKKVGLFSMTVYPQG